ncbi:MAG: hypothetical protein COT90_04980 [Candidatus Diapherotrites archaeon CG10_big_fil_rev_8_21_14_0_10_31_34]|nr:MAG: hypothetical protein COT90_04980 [Candidatus Diapherotrites archaeon CG10_big_fil_rev_8_21_14_0_10_31_34]PJA19605.1 MAG: hypothetical protein COX63_01435 [Candidatus Diapherotrites archaeon CG_4_10_14_0_2_um_filter_31_5]
MFFVSFNYFLFYPKIMVFKKLLYHNFLCITVQVYFTRFDEPFEKGSAGVAKRSNAPDSRKLFEKKFRFTKTF